MSDTRIFTNPAVASPASFSWEQVASTLGAEAGLMNLGHLATAGAVARGFGGDHAVIWYGADGEVQRVTYSELDRASAKAANLFARLGVQPGDRVFFVLPVIPELYYGYLGALRLGALAGVLSPGRNAEVVRNVLSRSRPKVVVGSLPFLMSPACRTHTTFQESAASVGQTCEGELRTRLASVDDGKFRM